MRPERVDDLRTAEKSDAVIERQKPISLMRRSDGEVAFSSWRRHTDNNFAELS